MKYIAKYGLPFLAYLIFPYNVKLGKRSKKRFIQKMKILDGKYHSGEWSEAVCQQRGLSLLAFTSHANVINWRKKVMKNIGQ